MLKTINVIEYIGGTIHQLVAFPDTTKGISDAETLFKKMARENGIEINDLDEGVCEKEDYQLFLVHSK